jgi:hypothetical protein
MPKVTLPSGETGLDVSVPKVTLPSGDAGLGITVPKVTLPSGASGLDVTMPKVTLPSGEGGLDVSVPKVTLPSGEAGLGITAPKVTLPSGAAGLDVTMPKVTLPSGEGGLDVSVPKVTLPSGGAGLDVTAPKVAVPSGEKGLGISSTFGAIGAAVAAGGVAVAAAATSAGHSLTGSKATLPSGEAGLDVSVPKVTLPSGASGLDVTVPKVTLPSGETGLDVSVPKVTLPSGEGGLDVTMPKVTLSSSGSGPAFPTSSLEGSSPSAAIYPSANEGMTSTDAALLSGSALRPLPDPTAKPTTGGSAVPSWVKPEVGAIAAAATAGGVAVAAAATSLTKKHEDIDSSIEVPTLSSASVKLPGTAPGTVLSKGSVKMSEVLIPGMAPSDNVPTSTHSLGLDSMGHAVADDIPALRTSVEEMPSLDGALHNAVKPLNTDLAGVDSVAESRSPADEYEVSKHEESKLESKAEANSAATSPEKGKVLAGAKVKNTKPTGYGTYGGSRRARFAQRFQCCICQ